MCGGCTSDGGSDCVAILEVRRDVLDPRVQCSETAGEACHIPPVSEETRGHVSAADPGCADDQRAAGHANASVMLNMLGGGVDRDFLSQRPTSAAAHDPHRADC